MRTVLLAKDQMSVLLEALLQDHEVFAPVNDDGVIAFRQVDSPQQVLLDYHNSTLPPKGLFFPQTETLFAYSLERGQLALEEPQPASRAQVLFGVRPCDARSLTMLDKVFRWDGTEDPYYLERRGRTTVVALACNEPGPTCFCTSVGGSPGDETGADVLATDLGDALLLRAVTDRGEVLLRGAGDAARPAAAAAAAKARELAAKAEGRLTPVTIPTDAEGLVEAFEADVWSDLALGCLGCGACTYSCPTCHCFDITDEGRKGAGRRVRSWDTCSFPLFTLHSSGHNPRPTKGARLRQRILHKFSYCPENFGEAFCVGCGRCIVNCPSGIDIRRILERLVETTSKAGGSV